MGDRRERRARSGQRQLRSGALRRRQSDTRTVSLSTLGGTATTVTVTGTTGTGVTYGAALSGSIVSVSMSAAKGASAGGHQAILRVFSRSTEIAHAAVYTLIK